MMRYLSHPIRSTLPVYGEPRKRVDVRQLRSLQKGDSCNAVGFSLEGHWGTHVDLPSHFYPGGKTIDDYSAGSWHFRRPETIRVFLAPTELLTPSHLPKRLDAQADLLLLRSGWSRKRGSSEYSKRGPGVHEDVADHLRKAMPKLRAVGLDWISLSSFARREEGRAAHRAFLRPDRGRRPLLILEDMDLSRADRRMKEVWVAPLRLEGADGVPCTVTGVWP